MVNKSLKRNAIYNIIYKTLNVIFPLISIAYVSRVLLSYGVGRVSAVQNNVSYFLIPATLGIPTYGIREIAKNRDDEENINKLFNELFTLNAFLTLVTSIIFYCLVTFNNYFGSEKILYKIFGLTILLNIFNVDWLFQGLEEYDYIAIRSIIVKITSLALLLCFVRTKADIYIYSIIQVAGITGNYLLNILRCKKYIKLSFQKLNISRHIRPLLYLALCSVSTELYAKMDITMLDYMKTSEIVGYYANSQKLINIIVTTLVAVTSVFLPRLSYLFDINRNKFNEILRSGFELMVTVSFPACAGLICISKPLVLALFGNDFNRASITVSILSFMIPLKCVGDLICYQVMVCAKQENILMESYFITMIVNLVNNLILIPKFGAEGAAIASVISEILAFCFVLRFSKKYFLLNSTHIVVVKTLVCTVIMCIAIIPFALLKISNIIVLLMEMVVGIVTFYLSSIVTKHEVVIHYTEIIANKISKNKSGAIK